MNDFETIDMTEANEYWQQEDERRQREYALYTAWLTAQEAHAIDSDDDYEPDGPTLGNSMW